MAGIGWPVLPARAGSESSSRPYSDDVCQEHRVGHGDGERALSESVSTARKSLATGERVEALGVLTTGRTSS